MAKINFTFEEVLSKTVEIEVPDQLINDKNTEAILDIAIEKYNNEEVILGGDNCIASYVKIDNEDVETGFHEI